MFPTPSCHCNLSFPWPASHISSFCKEKECFNWFPPFLWWGTTTFCGMHTLSNADVWHVIYCERESKCATACCFHCLSFKSLLFSFVFVFVFATFLSCLLLPYSCLFTGCFYWNPLKMIFSRFFLFFSSFAFVFEFVYMIFFFCLLFPFSFFLSFQSISIFFPEDFSFSAQTLTQAALKPETETGIPPPWEDFFCTIVAADAL